MESENFMEDLEAIKKEVSSQAIKISKVKGRSDSMQEEIENSREELEGMGYTFDSLDEIDKVLEEKGKRIGETIENHKEVLGLD